MTSAAQTAKPTTSTRDDAAVYPTVYEITGDGIAIAEAHYRSVDEAHQACLAVAREFGASGIRPAHDGSIKSLAFDDSVPAGFRQVGYSDGWAECVPHRATARGKAAAKKLASAPSIPGDLALTQAIGWPHDMVFEMARCVIHNPVAVKTRLPKPRYFVKLPRRPNDGWSPSAYLVEVPQSELMRAIEAHNAAIKAIAALPTP